MIKPDYSPEPRHIRVNITGDVSGDEIAARMKANLASTIAEIHCEQHRHDDRIARQKFLLKRRLKDLRKALRRSKPCPKCGRRML